MRKPRHIKGTGSIFSRPGSPYLYVGYWNGKRFVKESAKTTDEQVAQALLDKRREQVRTRRHMDPRKQERITVNELLDALEAPRSGERQDDVPKRQDRAACRVGRHAGGERRLPLAHGDSDEVEGGGP